MKKLVWFSVLFVALALIALGVSLWYRNYQAQIMQKPPKAPYNLDVKSSSSIEIQLTWTDASNNELGFRVMRDGQKVSDLPEGSEEYLNEGLRPATTYRYEIVSYNLVGENTSTMFVAKTKNPPIRIWLEKIGVNECGEEGESFRELWDVMRNQPITGEIQVGFVATDGKNTFKKSVPSEGFVELKQDEVLSVPLLIFESEEIGDSLRLFATAYEQDGGFKEELIYEVMDIVTGVYIGTPTSLLLTLAEVDLSNIYAEIFGVEDDWLGSYISEWTNTDNWGVDKYIDVQCKRENGNVGLRLWFRIECPVYDYSLEDIPP